MPKKSGIRVRNIKRNPSEEFIGVADILDFYTMGQFRVGLTGPEIKCALSQIQKDKRIPQQYRKLKIEKLMEKFNTIAGINTVGVFSCPICKERISLLYRHDAVRFADKLFFDKKTYWD